MNKQFVFIKILFFVIFSLLIFDIEKVYSYSCLPYTCSSIGGRCTDSVTLPSGWCYEADMLYSCGGTDRNCTGGYDGTTCGGEPTHCPCCDTGSLACDDCTPGTPTCPANTTTTNTGDLWKKLEICCDNGDGCDDNCNSESCYCYLCTLPDCDPLKNDDLGWGDYPQYKSCQNTPIDGNCSTRYRTCYCEEPPALPACPSPLLESNPVGAPNMILPNFKYTFNICDVYKYGDCYEPVSSQPVETLVIDNDPANGYGFLSNTHTGIPQLTTNSGNLNEPVKMIASYTDINGANDIEALGVWFRDQSLTGEVNTPIWISTTAAPDAPANNSWGFMMVKEGGIWVPYVPSWAVDPAVWTKAIYDTVSRSFMIPGPDRGNMVEVRITSAISSSGNTVTMPFSLRFSDPSILTESVSQTTYDVLLMGLDTFSFTPYNNYTFPVSENWRTTVQDNPATPVVDYWEVNKLRYRALPLESQTYARDWAFSNVTAGWMGNKWTIDKIAPTIQFINNTPSASSVIGNTIKIEWQATDEKSLYSIVGNIYTTASLADVGDISIIQASSGVTLKYGLGGTFSPTLSTSLGGVIGNLDTGWAFRVDPNMGTASHTGSITINIGENREGILIFYLTAFDDAGNVSMPQYDQSIFDINDWLVTDGGLVYSLDGSTFSTKTFTEDPGWAGILPPIGDSGSLLYNLADLSSELFAQGQSSTSPSSLVNSPFTKSYNIKNYPQTKVTSFYDNFLRAYERDKTKMSSLIEISPATSTIESNLNGTGACGGQNQEFCVLKVPGNLSVNASKETFICNRKAAIFVEGNLTISPDVRNHQVKQDDSLGCIFIVKGDVIISEGSNASSKNSFLYDVLNAYILADGEITIEHEDNKLPQGDPDVIDDADDVTVWQSTDSVNTILSQELNPSLYTEETGSIKVTAADNYTSSSETIDLMEYSTDALAQAAYYTGVGEGVIATGGIMTTVGSDVVHTFNSGGRFTITRGGNVQVLVVGGGGGGGGNDCGGGGGGAGGVIYNPSFPVSSGTYVNITVGAGGLSYSYDGASNGRNSTFSTLVARGGGAGGDHAVTIESENGNLGGSGGGGAGGYGTPYGFRGAGIAGQGNSGGNGVTTWSTWAYRGWGGGGGGGAGAGGQNANYLSTTLRNGGDGGIGVANSISGTLKYYGGGGGGGALYIAKGGLGGLGGGGNARYSGAANTGGGGGGNAGSYDIRGGYGGSGVVIVRYSTSSGVMVYHEPTIVQQGSYALKVVADQTVSLNKTAVKTFPTPLNLSGNTYLSFYMRSNRTGSNISVGIRDTGGTVTQITPEITVANGYQKFTLDLSGVSDVNKDAINQLIITILNADASNTLYIDNVVSGYDIPASLDDVVWTQKSVSRNMSNYDLITFWIRSTQAGASVQFQFGESTYSERTFNVTIPNANEWVPVSIDITGIRDNLLDRVLYYAFRIININPGESFYFDDIRNENLFSPDDLDYGEIIDGLYMDGGLLSLDSSTNPSIQILRYLRLEERLRFPVLVIDYHPKYGILAEQFFGNTYTLQKTEVGFKP